ncbi:hypothetical protein VPHK406_0100 [Vibrio phage K406]
MNNKFYTGISSEYVHTWSVWQGFRELIANAVDQDSRAIEEFNAQGQRWVSVQSFGATIPKEMFLMGKSGKRGNSDSIGQFGEGLLLALLVLLREGKDIRIKNGFDKLIATLEPHPQLGAECLALEVVENFYGIEDTDGNSVDITIHGLTEEDSQVLNENYLKDDFMNYIYDADLLVNHAGCQIFRYDSDIHPEDREDLCDKGNPKKVFVNGLFVCDLPDDYVFSYNLTPDRITLDRDRQSVSTWDLQREVATLLEDAGAFELMVRMSEEKVPDLYEYYTPSRYKSVSSSRGMGSTQTVNGVLNKLATEAFVKRHGEKAMAVNQDLHQSKRDIIKNRLKLGGYTPVEVPRTNFDMLDKSVTQVPDSIPVKNTTPKVMLERYFEANKKHIRRKARKEMEKLIEDLILVS